MALRAGPFKISLKDVPDHIAVHDYLFQTTDLKEQMAKFKTPNGFHKFALNYPLEDLRGPLLKGAELYGLYPFQYAGEKNFSSAPYLSASLTSNPFAHDAWDDNPHRSTLGSALLKKNSAHSYQENQERQKLRNSYHDTYAFTQRTPLSSMEGTRDFLCSFKRTLVRSRLSVIAPQRPEALDLKFNWHNDESLFINLRINVPIMTNEGYAHQLLTKNKENEPEILECFMEEGAAYVYNTELFHRAYCRALNDSPRVNLICGVSPWFDFIKEEQCWVSNEYYGEVHPYEMLGAGLITPYIQGAVL